MDLLRDKRLANHKLKHVDELGMIHFLLCRIIDSILVVDHGWVDLGLCEGLFHLLDEFIGVDICELIDKLAEVDRARVVPVEAAEESEHFIILKLNAHGA